MSTPQEYMDRLFSQASAPATPAATAGRAAGLAAATGYGGESTVPGLEADIRTMSASALAQKYGYETAMQALGAQGQAAAQYNGLVNNQSRSSFGAVDDTVQGVADGFVNSVMGIAGLATGALSDPGGSAVAGANQDYNDWSFLQRSDQMRSRLAARELRNEMRQRDNDAAYEADKQTNGDGLMTGLRRIGREALSGGAAMFDDGSTFGEDVSQAIGSLATAGPIGKGITAAGKGVAAAARATAPRLAAKTDDALAALTVSNPRLASVIEKTGQNAGTMAGITAMEAGGAYNSTMQDVASLPFDTLMQHSPVFAELVAQGMSLEDARDQVGNAAALQAAGWTGLMAAPLSALVARFEGNLFSSVPLGRGIANMGAEAVEEGGIGLGGGLAQNAAVRDNADATRSLTVNVGEQVGQGAILGSAAAGAVQAPRMAGQATAAVAGKALNAVAGSTDAVANREQAAVTQVQAREVQQAVEAAEPTLQTLTPEGQAKWNEIREVYEFNAEEFFGGQAPPEVMEALGPAVNTPDAVSRMIKLAETTKDPALKQQMALLAFEQSTYMDAILEDPDTFTVAGVPEADAAMAAMASAMSTAWKGDSREKLRKQAAEIYRAQLEQGTPEQQVQAAENLVVADPLSAEPAQIRTVLQHAENGIGNMSPQSRAALEAALEVVEADRTMRAQMESEGYEPSNNDKVSEQVRSSQEWGDGTAQSLGGHVARLLNFVRQGATNAAAEQAEHLANFAQHMSNKVEALNAHYAAGPETEPMGYEQYTKEGRWRTQKGGRATGLGVTPQSKKSLQNARAIEADARMTVNTLNAMADAFPHLGLSKLPLPKLADPLQGPMEEVLERHRPVKQGPAPIKRGQTVVPDQAPPVPTPEQIQEIERKATERDASKSEPTKQEESATVARPTATPEQVQAKKDRYAQQKAAAKEAKEAKKEEAPAPVVSRVTPEQAKRLSDEGLNERLQNLVGKRADGKATPEDNATFDVLDAEMIEREDASAVEVELMAPVVEAQAAPQEEITETVEDVTPVEEAPAVADTKEAPTTTATDEESAPASVEVEPKGGLKADPEMVARFPNLLPTSWFRHIFRSTGENVVLAGRSIEELADLLNTDELTSLAPNVGPLEPEVVEGYQELLEDMLPQLREIMAQRMENFLKVPYKKGSNQKNLDVLLDSNVFEHTASGRVLQTAQDYGEDGILYNEEILNAALLSATQWYLNAGESPAMSADEWTDALGVVVSVDMANQLNAGAHYENAIDEVAQRLTRYLGIQGNNDAPQGMVQGVQFALAQEALESLIQAGAIRIENVSITSFSAERGEEDTEATRKIRRIHVDKSKLHPGLVGEGGDSNVIERLLAKDPEGGRFYVGDEIPKPIASRHNQPRVLNTPEQMEVQRRMSAQPYTMNVPFNNFLSSLDKDGALHLFAEGPIAPDSLNKYDAEAREGRNLGVINALDAIQALTNRMKSVDEDLSKVPVRYAFNFTSVNRMMMLGDSNPQANKVMRALMLPTWSTVDVTQGQGRKNWILGVAQGLGLKVHKESFGKIEADLNKLLTTELKPVMDTLRGWQKNNRSFTAEQAKELRDQLKAAGVGDPAWGMFVLLEQARLDNAPLSERRKFTTPMYLEADGVTNGPIMGMGMLMTQPVSLDADKLRALHKGGVAIGRTEERLNYADMHAEDKVDLYGSSGTYTPAAIADMLSKADPKFRQITINMIKVMTDFYGAKKIGFKKVDGNVVMHIDRGMTKNPLTITLYGSGARGIAGNFVDEMKVEYHKRMSELRATLPKDAPRSQVLRAYADRYGAESLKNLEFMQKNLVTNSRRKGLQIKSNLDGSADWKRDFRPLPKTMRNAGSTTEDMTFSKLDEINMSSFIQHLFVEPLRTSITQAVGGDVMEGMETLQRITSAQSELAVGYFEKALNDRLDAKLAADPDFRKADFLTGKELDEIFANMEKIFPRIEINGMTFDLMGKMKSFLKNVYVSDILKGTDQTKENRKIEAKTFGPASLGVGGIPAMIIGSGDASMILKAYLADYMENTLSVYDGVHLPMDKVQDQSLVLNQQAYAAMLSNPIKAVWDSAKVTLSEGNREALVDMLLADLRSRDENLTEETMGRTVYGKFLQSLLALANAEGREEGGIGNIVGLINSGATDAELQKGISNQLASIVEGADAEIMLRSEMIEINHKVVASLGAHVDQMASGDAPARIEPNQESFAQDPSYEEIAEEALGRVKTLMLESENETVRELAEGLSTSPIATTGLPALAPSSVGTKLPSGATLMSVEHLLERSRAFDLTPVQKEFMREALRSGALNDWAFVTGTPEQLSAYSTSAGKALSPEADSVVHGAIDLETKTVLLPETANETLVHEMVHAATIQNVINALTGEKVSNHVKNAVRNLEALLEDFMAIQPERMPAGTIVAHANARATIERYLLDGTPEGKASAINEMMAWVLGNKSLQEALSKKSAPKRVVEFTQKLFNAVKHMFWGSTTMSAPASDFVSQLLFNSKVLANVAPKIGTKGDGSLQHSTQDSALRRLKEDLSRRLNGFTEMVLDPRSMKSTEAQVMKARTAAKVRLNELEAGGFRLAGEARDVSEALMTVLGTTMQLDPSVMNTTQRVYDHVMQKLTPQSFEDIGVDRDQASEMYDALSGKQSQGRDPNGRSLLLPSFLAMAMVHPELRQVLSNMPAIEKTKVKSETLDQTLDNLGTASMDALDRSLSGLSGKERSVQEMIDSLQAHVAAAAAQEGSWLVNGSQNVQSVVDKSNDYLVSLLGRVDQAAVSGIASLRADPNSRIRRVTADALEVLRAGLTDEGANAASEAATALFNQKGVWKWARDLATDIIGRTDLNAPLFDMIKIVRTKVQQMRQHYRDDVPAIFHKEFKNAPSAQQYAAMSRVLGQTDIASLLGTMTVTQVQNLLSDPASLAQALASAKSAMILAAPKGTAREVEFKANQLARYLMTGEPGVGLLRNSYAIAKKSAKDTSVEQAIDGYVTLAALSQSNPKDLAALQDLMENDSAAVMFMVQYNKQQLDWDRERMEGNELAKLNHFKGYLPNPVKPGQRLVVRPVSEHADLVMRGYTQLDLYRGSSAERVKEPQAYYFSPVDGQAMFNQGLIQNTQQTVGGVQLNSGYSLNHTVAGRITSMKQVTKITNEIATKGDKGLEALMPVFDAEGVVVAYERSIRRDMQNKIVDQLHYGKALGMWRGRQAEERAGEEINKAVVQQLKNRYRKASATEKASEFINLRSMEAYNDPQIRDAASLFTKDVVEMFAKEFGENGPIWIERTMLKDVIGYRAATIGDMWTGTSRLSPVAVDTIKDVMSYFMDKKAYQYAVNAERFVQGVVTDARVLIAVKSVVVPAVNIVSNMLHLISRGVPLHKLGDTRKKLNEVHQYVQSEIERVETETRMTGAISGSLEHRRLVNRLQAIEDSQRRLSIWPLIEAGEFSSIAEVGLNHEDLMLSRGRLSDFIETQIDKLPTPVGTVAHNLLLSKHTALFRGLQRTVQYGDFVAKAVLFDHLVDGKKMTAKQALARITEEFVHYDRLPGRTRGYLESVGLLWFYNFKLRSVKVAFSTMRNNPLHTLLAVMAPTPDFLGTAGLPVEDNALSKLLGGSLGYSIGPGQGFNAIGLNPWLNAIN